MSAPSSSSLSVITVTSYRRKIWLLYLFLDIIKRAVFGLACVACKAARGEHAKGRGGLLSFFLIVRLRHFFFRHPPKMAPATQSMIGYDEGNNSGTFTRVLKHGMNLSGTYQGLRR